MTDTRSQQLPNVYRLIPKSRQAPDKTFHVTDMWWLSRSVHHVTLGMFNEWLRMMMEINYAWSTPSYKQQFFAVTHRWQFKMVHSNTTKIRWNTSKKGDLSVPFILNDFTTTLHPHGTRQNLSLRQESTFLVLSHWLSYFHNKILSHVQMNSNKSWSDHSVSPRITILRFVKVYLFSWVAYPFSYILLHMTESEITRRRFWNFYWDSCMSLEWPDF